MDISGAKLEVHCCNISRDILYSVLYHLVAHFVTSLLLTKIGIIYTQVLQEETCVMHENAQTFEWKFAAKFSATTLSYSMVKIASLDDAFSEFFGLGASPVASRKKIISKGEKEKAEKNAKILQMFIIIVNSYQLSVHYLEVQLCQRLRPELFPTWKWHKSYTGGTQSLDHQCNSCQFISQP